MGKGQAYLFTHGHLRALAGQEREAISLRDYGRLADVVRDFWKANKLIHPSTTNDEVEELLASTRQNWRSVKLLGAGGGGYALFFASDRRNAESLRAALDSRARGQEAARIVDFSLSTTGLQLSVS